MVTYEEFTNYSIETVTEDMFTKLEQRSVDFLSSLCGSNWNAENEICKKAVIFQIEAIIQNGGLSEWSSGSSGQISSRSYSVGGESESVAYGQASKATQKVVNGLIVSSLAWQILQTNGFLQSIKQVRIW